MDNSAPLMLSVSGARGIVGKSMTPQVTACFAYAFGQHICRGAPGVDRPLICLGRDSRPSGQTLLDAAATGLHAAGCNAVDLGIVATPTTGVMIQHLSAQGGMEITASHNPSQWNGLKCLDGSGAAPPALEAATIIESYRAVIDAGHFDDLSNSAEAAAQDHTRKRNDNATDVHIRRVLALVNVEAIAAAKFTVALDSINGAGSRGGKLLLDALGVHVHHLNAEPDGNFAHTPEPIAENLTTLCDTVRRAGDCACGFAQDPDADRLAIVDEHGVYIGEEYTLALCALRALERCQQQATDDQPGPVLATNLSTSRMIDDIAARFPGARVLRTAVGEANVVHALREHGKAALMGGEGNGGVIVPNVCWVRDSLISMALVLDLLAARGAAQPLSAIVQHDIPRYTVLKRKFDLAAIGGRDALPHMFAAIKAQPGIKHCYDSDGVRLDFENGWVHLRPSNTEPIVRLIAEAQNDEAARSLIATTARAAGLPVASQRGR
ncbi:MAG: phosphoglucosamine mutase [Phycisphaerales bacterium]